MINKELTLRVLSIDPGFNNMGVSFNTLNYHTGLQVVNYCTTYKIPKLTQELEESNVNHCTSGMINITAVKSLISGILSEFKPDVVVCEAAYLSRFPQAFVSLSLCLHAIESATFEYDYDVGFMTIDPSSVKVANGVKGNSKDKEDMRRAIMTNAYVVSAIDFNTLDEHAIDSICIGYCYFTRTRV